jgi:hypothetical protein
MCFMYEIINFNITMLHFELLHSVACSTNSLLSCIHANSTKLHNTTCTLVATCVILCNLECFSQVSYACNACKVALQLTHNPMLVELNFCYLLQINTSWHPRLDTPFFELPPPPMLLFIRQLWLQNEHQKSQINLQGSTWNNLTTNIGSRF